MYLSYKILALYTLPLFGGNRIIWNVKQKTMTLTIITIYLIGVLGFVLNKRNIIMMLISVEVMLLAITFLILLSSINLDDMEGHILAIYIIVVAGAESALGLAILVAFYRLRGSINIANNNSCI